MRRADRISGACIDTHDGHQSHLKGREKIVCESVGGEREREREREREISSLIFLHLSVRMHYFFPSPLASCSSYRCEM